MPRIVAPLILLLGGLLELVACAGPGSDGLVFAVVPKAMNNPFFDQARDGCKQAESELAGVECLYIGPGEHTEAEQVQIVEDLITRRVDGVAVAPSNAPAMARVLARARDAGIPVLTWDSDLLEEDRDLRATYIGTENYQIGVEQAKLIARLEPDGGTLCIQSGGPAALNHNERMQGIRDTLAGAESAEPPGERLIGGGSWTEVDGCPLYSNDDFALAVQQIADVLTRYPDLDALVVTGGFPQFAGQAYREVAERHRARLDDLTTAVVVADTLPVQMELLRDGLSHAQIGQRPFEMGYRAVYTLRDLRAGVAVADPIYTGLDVCTRETVATCLDAE